MNFLDLFFISTLNIGMKTMFEKE